MKSRMTRRFVVGLGVVGCSIICGGGVLQAQQTVADGGRDTDSHVTNRTADVFSRLVTVELDRVSLTAAVQAIAAKAGIRVQYHIAALDAVRAPVTLHVQNVPLGKVFEQILTGTQLAAIPLRSDVVSIESAAAAEQQGAGAVRGIVTNGVNKKPIEGAVVSVDSGKPVRTGQNGVFLISGLSAGKHQVTVRFIGYRVYSIPVTIRDDATETLAILLTPSATTLTDVVTTGSGERKRYEVGNAVATINADSVVPNTPLRNLSDLLNGRVPGMEVENQSGEVGTGSRIRIRGLSSLLTSEDPIVIVDGVRMDAAFSQSSFSTQQGSQPPGSNQASPYISVPASSRLNDIDVNSIESIDVLRGPAASTMYGSDAANGVIVIKTKQGRPGPTRWSLSGNWGTSSTSNTTFPDSYNGWGEAPNTLPYTGNCTLYNVSQHQCTQDSVSSFNPLNVSGLSPFANGNSQTYTGQVSGGSQAVQYSVTGTYDDQGGVLGFPDALKAFTLSQLNGNALPSWALHPNSFTDMHLTSRLSIQLGQSLDVGLNTIATNSHQIASPQGVGGIVLSSINSLGYRDSVSQGWGLTNDPGIIFLTRNSDNVTRTSGSASGNWHPGRYFAANATGGVDYTSRDDESLLPQSLTVPTYAPNSMKNRSTSGETVQNVNIGTTLSLPWRNVLFRTGLGAQYEADELSTLQASASNLLAGSESINGASTILANEFTSEVKTAGWYLQEEVQIQQQFFLTVAMREDKSSAFGAGAKPVVYPKFNGSWLISQAPFFPQIPGLSSLRLRGAFGQAGSQPDISARFLTYEAPTYALAATPTYIVNTIGNDNLKPERSQEIEGGFDLGLGDDRVTLEATVYDKTTKDALVNLTLPPSVGVTSQVQNLGQLSNRGIELSGTLRPIESRMFDWSTTLGYSKNTNRVDALGTATQLNGAYGRFVVGYPVDGVWSRAILGVQDINNNHIIEPSELLLTDSVEYAGSGTPSGQFNWHNSVGLWSGRVTVSASLAYTGAMTQINGMLEEQCTLGHCQGAVDPNASAALQTLAAADEEQVIWPFLERTSVLRFDEFTLSVIAPNALTRALHAQSATIALMGRNLGMWTHYRGADPSVNAPGGATTTTAGDAFADYGGVPQPRDWSISFHVSY